MTKRLFVTWMTVVGMTAVAHAETPQATATAPAAAPQSPGPMHVRQASIYADVRARAVGDIVTVAIIERASASNTSRLSTKRQTSFDNSGTAGTGALSFLPDFGMSADLGRTHEGTGQSTQEGRLTARLSATVIGVKENGDLEISGQREVSVNDERETIQLTGTIRPIDIGAGNVVYSTDIADAKIVYKGKGQVSKGSHPNVIARLFSLLF